MAFETLREQPKLYLARLAGFYLSVLAFVFFWVLAFGFHLGAVFYGWFDPVLSDTIHFVHDISLATWVWVWGAAMVVQLYRPAKRVTTMQVALIMTLADMTAGIVLNGFDPIPILTSDAMLFFAPVFVAAALHPARGELLPRRFGLGSVDLVTLGLAVVAAVPVLLYVLGQIRFQTILTDEHAEFGHYATMGYYGLSLIGLALLTSVRTRGRRFAAYGAGMLAAMLAIASVFNPTMSGLDTMWATLAVLWAVAFVGVYELTTRRTETLERDPRMEDVTTAQ